MLWVIMRTQITVFLLILSSASFGQQLVLDSMNWNAGEYKFYFVEKRGIEEEVEPLNPTERRIPELPFQFQIDSTNSFLIADQQQLQNLKSNWEGVPTDEMLLCWYDYFVYVVQNNIVKHELRVNLECGQVVTDFGIFDFEGNPFEQLQNKIPVWVMSSKHETVDSGREFIASLNPNIILTEKDEWFDFDGHFWVDRQRSEGSIEEFEQLIHDTYKKQDYKLSLSGFGPNSFTFTVYSDSTFHRNFEFEKKGKWYDEKTDWIIYFSEDSELIKQLLE